MGKIVGGLIILLLGWLFSKYMKVLTPKIYVEGWRESLFWMMSFIVTITMILFYCADKKMASLERLGHIGSFLAGIGLFLVGCQYLTQAKSAEIDQHNDELNRAWNMNSLLVELVIKYNDYIKEREKSVVHDRTDRSAEIKQSARIARINLSSVYAGMISVVNLFKNGYCDIKTLTGNYGLLVAISKELDSNGFNVESINLFLNGIDGIE